MTFFGSFNFVYFYILNDLEILDYVFISNNGWWWWAFCIENENTMHWKKTIGCNAHTYIWVR